MATDPELVQRARTLRSAGLSIEQIATRLDLRSRAMVYRWVRDLPVPQWTARPNAKDDLRERARVMRVDGATYDQIVERLGVSKSSVSLWVRDLPHPERTPEGEARRRQGLLRYSRERSARVAVERQEYVQSVAASIGALTERDLIVAGAVAYWAEGTKNKAWRVSDRVTFVNSDVDMIRLFLAFLRLRGVAEGRLRFRVSIHESADEAAAREHWSEVVGHPATEFQRSTLKHHVVPTVRKNVGEDYHGCLVITVNRSRDVYREIEGLWSGLTSGLCGEAGLFQAQASPSSLDADPLWGNGSPLGFGPSSPGSSPGSGADVSLAGRGGVLRPPRTGILKVNDVSLPPRPGALPA